MNWGIRMTDRMRGKDAGLSEAGLDSLFAEAKAAAPLPDAALLARVMADAGEVQAGFAEPAPLAGRTRRSSRIAGIFEMIGGWGGLGGLATATAFGLWLGMSPALGLGEMIRQGGFGAAATLDTLGEEYAYLADLGEN